MCTHYIERHRHTQFSLGPHTLDKKSLIGAISSDDTWLINCSQAFFSCPSTSLWLSGQSQMTLISDDKQIPF